MRIKTQHDFGDKVYYRGQFCGEIVGITAKQDTPIETKVYYEIKLDGQYRDLRYPFISLEEDELDCGGPYTTIQEVRLDV